MDGDDRRASQYGQPYQTPGSSRSSAGQPMGPPTTDRYAQPTTPARVDSRPSVARPYLPGYPGYGYAEQQHGPPSMHSSSPMQGVEMQYSPAYVQDVSRQQQVAQPQPHQQYGSYGPGSMLPSAPPQPMYEGIPSYQQRQSAALEVMTSQLGAIPQYIQPGEQAGIALPPGPSHYISSRAEQPQYSGIPASRPTLQQQYGSAAVDYPVIEQPAPQATDQAALNEGFRNYEQQLKASFDAILAGRLTEAGEKLLTITRWLAGAVVVLGLHHDDETRYAERLDMWTQFNLCWEALGQKQKNVTEEALRTRRQPADFLSAEAMRNMIDVLLSVCDQLEQYGLVDYEMGIAEEQITHIFTKCLDMLPQDDSGARQFQGESSAT